MKRKSVISLVLVGLLACLVGCNSNPVAATSGSDTLLGYSQDARVAESNTVDILWVIDNSGSMGDEQVALGDEFKVFVAGLAATKIDFQMAVTTTDAGNSITTVKGKGSKETFFKGELRDRPSPIPGGVTWMNFAQDPGYKDRRKPAKQDWVNDVVTSYLETAKRAWNCVKNDRKLSPGELQAKLDDLEKLIRDTVKDAYDNNETVSAPPNYDKLSAAFPAYDDYQVLGPVLKSKDYLKPDGSFNNVGLIHDFACIALVGTVGNGVEKGLQAMAEATAPVPKVPPLSSSATPQEKKKHDDAVQKYEEEMAKRAPNRELIRPHSKFATIFVTDENDCTHFADSSGKDFNDQGCGAKLCNLFNAEGIPNNPMVPVERLKEGLLRNLRSQKEDPNFSPDNVIVAALTALSKREERGQDGFTIKDEEIISRFLDGGIPSESECEGIPYATVSPETANAMNTCLNFGKQKGFNGDRYIRFARLFPHHFPVKGVDQEGVICVGSFGNSLETVAKLFDSGATGCISQQIYGGCTKKGDTCGPEGYSGECKEVSSGSVNTLYCTSSILIVGEALTDEAYERLKTNQYCEAGTLDNVQGFQRACILAPDKYEFTGCPGGVKGIKFTFKNADSDTQLAGVDVKILYTAYAPEDEEADATGTNQTQK